MEKSDLLRKVFENVAREIAALSEEDLRKLAGNDYSLNLRVVRTRSKAADAGEVPPEDHKALIADLEKAENREDGIQVLEDALPSKRETEAFAKFLDISVLKQDKLSSIREKIVEATIGARLRSQAIQGKKT
jgi:hypothetical protein